jgi:hypothetical protein
VNADAPAHAVTDDGAALGVHLRSAGEIVPRATEDLDELAVGGSLLRFVHAVGGAEHSI